MHCVVFDCDGVLVDSTSSWRTLHEHFGTQNHTMLQQFIAGEIDDMQFMLADIEMWKAVQPSIHRDDIFRAYSGIKLMPGARDVVNELKRRGVYVAIVSAGVDIFVSTIAATLGVDDWVANGFEFDEDGFLLNSGHVRVSSHGKGETIQRLMEIRGFSSTEIASVGDSELDLSMIVGDSTFIGFNPSSSDSKAAFTNAGVPIVESKDLRLIWPFFYEGEKFPE